MARSTSSRRRPRPARHSTTVVARGRLASQSPQLLRIDGSPEWVTTQPCFIDWDLDGRLDLVYEAVRHSQDGTGAAFSDVMWQRNTGATGALSLVQAVSAHDSAGV